VSLALILQRAQTHVQRGQIEAALKLYKGLLVTVSNHPQVNGELGMLYLQHRTPQEAIKPLEKAAAALPQAEKIWICLLVAHHRCGNHTRVKELLATMRQSGFDGEELDKIERDLSELPPMDGGARHNNVQGATIWMTSFIPQASAYLRKVLSEGE
jgi:predicted Zn-dependent protease